jgi:hypothetical protein
MATYNLVSVDDTTPVRLTPRGLTHSGMDITIQNVNSSGYIYIGSDENVSDENYGYRLHPNHAWSVELSGKDHLYIISSAPSMKAAVMKIELEYGF